MNLLEHYIVEIHSVEKAKQEEWMDGTYVKVDLTRDCYGNEKRQVNVYPLSYWKEIKSKGYYMG